VPAAAEAGEVRVKVVKVLVPGFRVSVGAANAPAQPVSSPVVWKLKLDTAQPAPSLFVTETV